MNTEIIPVPHEQVETLIHYTFKKYPQLLDQAFIRRSYRMKNDSIHNEPLEHYGDAVIEYIVSRYLMKTNGKIETKKTSPDYGTYRFHENIDEGTLSITRANLINNTHLAKCIDNLDLFKYITMSEDEKLHAQNNIIKIKGDLFEALIGAIALDADGDIRVLEKILIPLLNLENPPETPEQDTIQLLHAWYQKELNTTPDYRYTPGFNGYECTLDLPLETNTPKQEPDTAKPNTEKQNTITFSSAAETRKEARNKVAEKAYKYLETHDKLNPLREYFNLETTTIENAVNKLQELFQKGACTDPAYTAPPTEKHDRYGNLLWICSCTVTDLTQGKYAAKHKTTENAETANPQITETWQAGTKKDAKKYAAYAVLCRIFGWKNQYRSDE